MCLFKHYLSRLKVILIEQVKTLSFMYVVFVGCVTRQMIDAEVENRSMTLLVSLFNWPMKLFAMDGLFKIV